MSSLTLRRAIVWVLSAVTGVLAALVIFLLLGTTFEKFGVESMIVVTAIGLAAMIWLDYFLSAEILPD
jgi:uncharacterized membrane protein YgaE (UPF0421/DUF939 family)